ncbi:MAG: GGDEF domain-containing protein [Gammaproteobacteria bacterium]|nr:MAG: GGDEF domain-containing protein [Gammaproteobacteria bacterium]
MKSFQWGKHFLTGIDEVDEQHHGLVETINDLSSHFAENDVDFDDVEETYKTLVDYAKHHFFDEEQMMIKAGLDERHLVEHQKIHQDFLQEVVQMHSVITPDNLESAHDLLEFLMHWLGYHILGTDQNMARQVKDIENGLSASAAYDKSEYDQNSSTEPLLAALNGLFQQVSKRNNELLLLNQSLEEKVARRTEALLEANKHFEELALTDVLTNLPNRRYAMQQFALLWETSSAQDNPVSCMMIDADHFKEVNDTYGHDAGDLVLCELSNLLSYLIRTDDIVSRLGGDEFLIICANTTQQGLKKFAENIHDAVSKLRVETGDGHWQGSISVGIATETKEMEHFEDLIKLADQGVYAAKADGKNCVRAA